MAKKILIELSDYEINVISNAILDFALPAYASDLRSYKSKLKNWNGNEKTKPKMPITLNAEKAKDLAIFLKRQL